jgi:hypothetical protein
VNPIHLSPTFFPSLSLFELHPYLTPTRHIPYFPPDSILRVHDILGPIHLLPASPVNSISWKTDPLFCLPASNSVLRQRGAGCTAAQIDAKSSSCLTHSRSGLNSPGPNSNSILCFCFCYIVHPLSSWGGHSNDGKSRWYELDMSRLIMSLGADRRFFI